MNLQVPCIMAKFVFQDLLSLNGVVVPKVKHTLKVIGAHTTAWDLQLDLSEHLALEVELVSLKACADAQWMVASHKLQTGIAAGAQGLD